MGRAHELLSRREDASFWFRSRNRIILSLLRRHGDGRERPWILELGCGTGYVLRGLSDLPGARVHGTDADREALSIARRRAPEAALEVQDARRLRYEEAFDVVGAFDLLEHVDDDRAVLKGARRALRPGGTLLLTVPQHPRLWSPVDEEDGHLRRYRRRELRRLLEESGFEVLFSTSFVFLLLPVLAAARWLRRRRPASSRMTELELSPALDRALGLAMRLDELLIRAGLSLPFGGSLAMVARAKR